MEVLRCWEIETLANDDPYADMMSSSARDSRPISGGLHIVYTGETGVG